jgi:hypothetical protein
LHRALRLIGPPRLLCPSAAILPFIYTITPIFMQAALLPLHEKEKKNAST